MKKELQKYSNEKAEYVNTHYTEFWKYGKDYNTLDEYYSMSIKSKSPSISSYDGVDTINFTEGQSMLKEFKELYKDYINYEYEKRNDVYYVVYVEACPNGLNVNSNPCWAVYLLY